MSEWIPRRVVVTGLGLVTPLDVGVSNTWDKLCQGQSGIKPISRFDASQYSVRIAGEVKNFDPANFIEKKEVHFTRVYLGKNIRSPIQYFWITKMVGRGDPQLPQINELRIVPKKTFLGLSF